MSQPGRTGTKKDFIGILNHSMVELGVRRGGFSPHISPMPVNNRENAHQCRARSVLHEENKMRSGKMCYLNGNNISSAGGYPYRLFG